MKAEGIWDCDVLSVRYAKNDRDIPTVQINVQLTSGPSAGQRGTYEEVVDARSAKYLRWSCEAVGWKGETLSTLEADAAEWIKTTGGKSTAEVKHLEIKNGKNAGKVWDKINGIGRGAARALRPVTAADAASLKDADDAMRAARGGTGQDDAGPTDEIPFASSSMNHEPSPIARSVR